MIRLIQSLRVVLVVCCFTLASTYSTAFALPPLGLTHISSSSTAQSKFEIIDGAAYLNSNVGLWKLDSSGVPQQLSIGSNFTKVVKAADNQLYVATKSGARLYQLDPSPTLVHQYGYLFMASPGDEPEPLSSLIDIDSNLNAYGWFGNAARFDMAGNIENYPSPGDCCWDFEETTPSGYALGSGNYYDTIGSAPMVWNPDGTFNSYPISYSIPHSIRERLDGDGVNVGEGIDGAVSYNDNWFYIADNNGDYFYEGSYGGLAKVIVSHSNFTVVSISPGQLFGFYPGVVPGFDNRAIPLIDLFPQLATIDIDSIGAAASVGGNLYLTVSGSDGLYLFGTRDPSLIPEPATALLLLLGLPVALRRKR